VKAANPARLSAAISSMNLLPGFTVPDLPTPTVIFPGFTENPD
jgi:hypothetical protein